MGGMWILPPTGGSVKACNKGDATGLGSGISFWGTLRSYPSLGAPNAVQGGRGSPCAS